MSWNIVWFKYYAPQVRPHWILNSWPPDHDSAFHVNETPALTTRPQSLAYLTICVILRDISITFMFYFQSTCSSMNECLCFISRVHAALWMNVYVYFQRTCSSVNECLCFISRVHAALWMNVYALFPEYMQHCEWMQYVLFPEYVQFCGWMFMFNFQSICSTVNECLCFISRVHAAPWMNVYVLFPEDMQLCEWMFRSKSGSGHTDGGSDPTSTDTAWTHSEVSVNICLLAFIEYM